jgi:succinoglycan biosynthesis protein ExoM
MIAVSACTYKRPDQLARLLDSFMLIKTPADVEFVIVDNDGADPEVERVAQDFRDRSGKTLHLVVETRAGISAARNAAFAKARAIGAEKIAMVDDDEWVTENWLPELLKTQKETGAVIVGGPVRPVFSENRQDLAKHATLWSVERDYLGGKPFVFCTCNFMLDLAIVEPLGDEPFDHAYGLTGGGDTVFFRTLALRGNEMAWSEEAFIYEEIPDSRANIKWLRQRRYRAGNVAYRWETEFPTPSDMNPKLKTLAAVVRLPLFPLLGKWRGPLFLAWYLEFEKVRGRLAAQFGSLYAEYGRDPQKACR